ncbi:hypothetical protein AMTR_s00012p00124570 [Amborella trichopoda]|uniref:Uncharacterized protein n=1 Tax=Amborella trichopoda TaxID=13333 RepID=W1PJE4_AMBTC|nr:hypothetical protein AMTR_s00012p00124570 [Amborella trichopoda]
MLQYAFCLHKIGITCVKIASDLAILQEIAPIWLSVITVAFLACFHKYTHTCLIVLPRTPQFELC